MNKLELLKIKQDLLNIPVKERDGDWVMAMHSILKQLEKIENE